MGIQAQHPAPTPHAPHARHDRSMARNSFVAKAIWAHFSSVAVPALQGACPVSREHGHAISQVFLHASHIMLTIPGEHGENVDPLC